jgi:hypothetical protein
LRSAGVLFAVFASSFLVACGGGDSSSMRATMTDDDCIYEGDTSPDTGRFTIHLANKTEVFVKFALARLSEGKTIDDLQPYLEKGRREFLETGTLRAPPFPDFYEQVVSSGVGDGESGQLLADLPAGTYALMCGPDNVPMWDIYRAAQLDVTG